MPRTGAYTSDMLGRTAAFGEAGAYGRLVVSDMLPFIAAQYRADMARKVFVGHLYSSLLGLGLLLSRPATFGHDLLGSPSL